MLDSRLPAVRTPAPSHSNVPSRIHSLPQEPQRPVRCRIARAGHPAQPIRPSLRYGFLSCKLVFFIDPSLPLAHHRPSYTTLPLLEEAFLAPRHEFPVPAVRRAAVREHSRHYFPAARHEPEVRPAEHPEEREVEDPPEPELFPVGVLPAGTVDRDAVVRDGKGDAEVAAVVGRAYQGGEEGFEGGGIVVYDPPVEREGAHGVRRGDVGLDVAVGVWCGLWRAVALGSVATVGFGLR